MSKPYYIERGGEQVFQQPFCAQDVQFFGFGVKADKSKLAAICDKFLNAPLNEPLGSGDSRFVPAVSHVLFVFNRLGKLYAAPSSPDYKRGWYKEQEGAIWMLVLDRKRKNLFWFHPYMLVDSSYALCMGRAIYGFPKQYGWFDIPDGPSAPTGMHVDAVVAKDLDPNCQAMRDTLFSVRRVGSATSSTPHEEHTSLKDLVQNVAEALEIGADSLLDLRLDKNLCEDLIKTRIPMVFLKQIRDGVQADRACFQSVQECYTDMTKFHTARVFFDRYEVDFEDFASHPIRQDLGFKPGPIKVDVAFWSKFDFEIGLCTELQAAP
jgi:hypothetical protein